MRYILEEHKIVTATKQTRRVDPRIILLNTIDVADETLTLRLCLTNIYDTELFFYLFTSPEWDSIYTSKNLLDILAYLVYSGKFELMAPVLRSTTAQKIYLLSSFSMRKAICDLVNEIPYGQGTEASALLEVYPYSRLERDISNMSL